MSFFENIKNKAEDLAEEHGEKIEQGIEKAGDLVDEKTGGQHSEHVDTGVDKAKDFVEKLAEADDEQPA